MAEDKIPHYSVRRGDTQILKIDFPRIAFQKYQEWCRDYPDDNIELWDEWEGEMMIARQIRKIYPVMKIDRNAINIVVEQQGHLRDKLDRDIHDVLRGTI